MAEDSSRRKRTARAGMRSPSTTSSTIENGEALAESTQPAAAAPRRDPEKIAALTAYPVDDLAAPLLDAWKADVAAKGYDADAIHEALVKSLKDNGALYQ